MKVEIYDLHGKKVSVKPTHNQIILDKRIKEFADRNWAENHQGWKSSFIPVAENFIFNENGLTIEAGLSNYSDQFGAIKSILDGEDFAPRATNGLSVGTCALTRDGKVILPRRSDKVKHAPLVYNTFSGWMSSMNINKADCENPKLAEDPRLWNPDWQAENEFCEESQTSYHYALSDNPSTLIRGYGASFNWELLYFATMDANAEDAIKDILGEQEEFVEGRKEHDIIAAVPVESIETLLRNQPELQKEDERTFEPSDVTELILLDSSIGILYNEFERLTGNKVPKNLRDYLEGGGIELIYRPTLSGIYAPL